MKMLEDGAVRHGVHTSYHWNGPEYLNRGFWLDIGGQRRLNIRVQFDINKDLQLETAIRNDANQPAFFFLSVFGTSQMLVDQITQC